MSYNILAERMNHGFRAVVEVLATYYLYIYDLRRLYFEVLR